MKRSNSDYLNKYTLPNGVATNSMEFRELQKKLLIQNYQQQKYHEKPSSPTEENLAKSRQLMQHDYERNQSQKNLKFNLSSDLNEQMRIKKHMGQLSKFQDRSEQTNLTKHLTNIDTLQKQKQKQFNKKYKEEALQDIRLKQNNRLKQSNLNQVEKEYYRNRYSVGNLSQSYKDQSKNFTNPTHHYAQQIEQARDKRERQVVNPEHLQNSSFKITRRTDQLNGLDFMFQGNEQRNTYDRQNAVYKEMKDREYKEKDHLKSSLLAQIQEKEINKKSEKMQDFYNPYTSRDYTFKHHPINNPIDYRAAHDNKYMLKELNRLK